MHLWHITKLSSDRIELIYAHKYHVSIPCAKYAPLCPHVRVIKTPQAKLKERDAFPHFTALIVKTAQALITGAQEKLDLKQFTFLAIKYPLQVDGITDEHGDEYLKATATVMLPGIKGKAFISFILDKDTYTRWPLSMQNLKVDVNVAYGEIQEDVILRGLLESLSGFTPALNYGCLLDACAEATGQFV
ncbi:hypothetical protein C8Q80DRAFT_94776 [Daedaleopsis nitida]|nr:hypothetical protein C8Q80DRAFT_94776 [Daedaleopsis nitida]